MTCLHAWRLSLPLPPPHLHHLRARSGRGSPRICGRSWRWSLRCSTRSRRSRAELQDKAGALAGAPAGAPAARAGRVTVRLGLEGMAALAVGYACVRRIYQEMAAASPRLWTETMPRTTRMYGPRPQPHRHPPLASVTAETLVAMTTEISRRGPQPTIGAGRLLAPKGTFPSSTRGEVTAQSVIGPGARPLLQGSRAINRPAAAVLHGAREEIIAGAVISSDALGTAGIAKAVPVIGVVIAVVETRAATVGGLLSSRPSATRSARMTCN